MQWFIANANVSRLDENDFSFNNNGNGKFKFDVVTESSYKDMNTNEYLPTFFHVEVYGKQAEDCAEYLSVGSPIMIVGEIIKRPYKDSDNQSKVYEFILPEKPRGITFLEGREAGNMRKQRNRRKAEKQEHIEQKNDFIEEVEIATEE